MAKTFWMKLEKIQPGQLFISSAKLSEVMKSFSSQSIEPIPVKKLGKHVIFVNGHTRAFVAFLHDVSEVHVYWETDELDWEAYEICVEWCEKKEFTQLQISRTVLSHIKSTKCYGSKDARKCNKT